MSKGQKFESPPPNSKNPAFLEYLFIAYIVLTDVRPLPRPWVNLSPAGLQIGYYILLLLVFLIEFHLYRTNGVKKRTSLPFATLLIYNVRLLNYQTLPLVLAIIGVSIFSVLWLWRSFCHWKHNNSWEGLEYFAQRSVVDMTISFSIYSVYIIF